MNKRKVILVMDWLDVFAGSEQIARYLHEIYDFDKVYTLVNIMPAKSLERIFSSKKIEIETTNLQALGKHFRYALPFFPLFLKQLKIKEQNALIISVTHSVVKGIHFPKNSIHISYLVARNLKYVWDEKKLYFNGVRKLFSFVIPFLQKFDIEMSKRPTKIIAVSDFVSQWSMEKYQRKIATLNPPVNIDDFEFQKEKEDFYVSVGRLEPYKRYDILIEAFNQNGKKLIIIGNGSLLEEYKRKAKKNIEFKGYLFPENSKKYLKKAKAFVFCGKEDFGIALLEPQVCGTPVITFKEGGALDTVVENETGVFFNEQTSEAVKNAIEKFETLNLDANKIRNHSLNFSVNYFNDKFKALVDKESLLQK